MFKRKFIALNDGATVQPKENGQNWDTSRITSDELVDSVNHLPASDFKLSYIKQDDLSYSTSPHRSDEQSLAISFKYASQLSTAELNACFKLVESTSRKDYEPSSFGWHPRRKMREMREPEMRYLLVRAAGKKTAHQISESQDDSIEAFLSFMLTHDSTPAVPVLYVYEIHLSEPLRKLGLGGHLMNVVEGVAERVGVAKVMLTCFLSNARARGFYQVRGFVTDVSSPEDRKTRLRVMKPDYVIMSKVLRK